MKAPKLDTSSLKAWRLTKPRRSQVATALRAIMSAVPKQWRSAMQAAGLGQIGTDGPEWADCHDALQKLAEFDKAHGSASHWNMSDDAICELAQKLADYAGELDAWEQGQGSTLARRIDAMRMIVRSSGVTEPLALDGLGAIKRVQDARWWRRVLRVHVARVVEFGAIKLGVVNRKSGGYASNAAVKRREGQQKRNAAMLAKTLMRNEAGQVWTLGELAALSVANPVNRGGELMVRIRGAEEYADALGHVGLFVTLTCPSKFHPVTVGHGGRPHKNARYDGVSTPRDAQLWLRKMWARTRAELARQGVRVYGVRVAEPHHDATPHWHALIWAEDEGAAVAVETSVRKHWLSEHGEERGAHANRVNVKRMDKGGAAGYVAKYIAKSIGHHALAEHLDEAQGQLFEVGQGGVPGHKRVDAWASTWGIRQFQSIGMPAVSVWRELRRVTSDQAYALRVEHGDRASCVAWSACQGRATRDGGASWADFMRAMGGHALKRGQWLLRLARRHVEPGAVNGYGEAIAATAGRVVGVATRAGRWMVSRRIKWASAALTDKVQDVAERAALARPWTGFNNCTARMKAELRAALVGDKTGPFWRGVYT